MTITDAFFSTMAEAMKEAARRRSNPAFKDFLTRIEPSPYQGFRVRSFSAELFVDQLADGPVIGNMKHFLSL